MKDSYLKPDLEVILFASADVITTSPGDGEGGRGNTDGPDIE